ncbi:hypothetical protein BS47DRAFT_1482562 [Hydnum rufescens UP504]|uniref:C3H1-type domain-containing protein n=1 Tax=Hydnum rufescens UP504 TaxID=1448309 RepID=A0A9P6B6E7_9AGAM|nr:hypothetical protein BS47DRAFT_1482562 [Hydnum rufescens UP504]
MTIAQDPVWRIPTRPCPFYSSGKCYFAQACNFRHDITVKSPRHIRPIPQISYTLPDDESRRSSTESSVFSVLDLNDSASPENKGIEPDVNIQDFAIQEVEQLPEFNSPIQLVKEQDYHSSRGPETLAYLAELKDYHQRLLNNQSIHSAVQEVPHSDAKELASSLSSKGNSPVILERQLSPQEPQINSSETLSTLDPSPRADTPIFGSVSVRHTGLRPLRLPELISASATPPPESSSAYDIMGDIPSRIEGNLPPEVGSPPPTSHDSYGDMSLSEFYAHEPHEDSPILSVGFVDSPLEFTSPPRRPTPTPSITNTAHDAHATPSMPIATEPIYTTPADATPSRSHSTTESIRSTTRIPSRSNFFLPEALPTDLDRVPSPSVAFSHSPRGRPEASTSSNSIPSDIKEPSIPSSTSRLGSPISFDMYQHSPNSSHGRRGQPSFSPPTEDMSPVDSPRNPSLHNVRSSLSRRSSASRPRAKSGSEVARIPSEPSIPPLPTSASTATHFPRPPTAFSHSRSVASSSSRPHLFFALASDSPKQVSKLLNSGQADANDTAGPFDLPALIFSLSNDQLVNKTEIVKTLLGHGADPSVVEHLVPSRSSADAVDPDNEEPDESPLAEKIRSAMNPAIRYYLGRQGAPTQSQVEALQASRFDPLLRARFCLVGQDLALAELMRAVASHSRRKNDTASLSLVLAGPSGHGKSYLASRIGFLLEAPQYIVNMTNLRSQEDLMRAKSLAVESDDSENLLHFLSRHQGSRCVVILEEIEKTAEKQALHTLLMPWELGKLPAASSHEVIETSKVIWVCTSNAGEEHVFEFSHSKDINTPSTRNEYAKLMVRMRGRLADELGASIVSRVNAVLPFLPFTLDEQRALASETLSELVSREDTPPAWLSQNRVADELVDRAVEEYMEREGARSIHRAVQMLYEEGMYQ